MAVINSVKLLDAKLYIFSLFAYSTNVYFRMCHEWEHVPVERVGVKKTSERGQSERET